MQQQPVYPIQQTTGFAPPGQPTSQPHGQPQPQPGFGGQPFYPMQDFLQQAATQVMMNGGWQASQQYVNQNVSRWIDWPRWRYYWNVSNQYVLQKIALLLFPFRHKQWNRMTVRSETSGLVEGYKPPRYDINAPDLYIPIMSYITYILMVGLLLGTRDEFKPEVLTVTASTALLFTVVNIMFLKLGLYVLNVGDEARIGLADLTAYVGYLYISVLFVQTISFLLNSFVAKYFALSYAIVALVAISAIHNSPVGRPKRSIFS